MDGRVVGGRSAGERGVPRGEAVVAVGARCAHHGRPATDRARCARRRVWRALQTGAATAEAALVFPLLVLVLLGTLQLALVVHAGHEQREHQSRLGRGRPRLQGMPYARTGTARPVGVVRRTPAVRAPGAGRDERLAAEHATLPGAPTSDDLSFHAPELSLLGSPIGTGTPTVRRLPYGTLTGRAPAPSAALRMPYGPGTAERRLAPAPRPRRPSGRYGPA